jgi:hypothetical protein
MKRSTFVFIIACISTLSIVGCKNTNKKTQQENTIEISLASKALDVNGLLNVAEKQLNDTVVLKGVVKHTCSHSGRRCFIADSTGKLTIRVEAGGNIQSFNKELVNSEIVVTGVLQEQRLSQEYIDNWEKKSQKKRLKETKMPTTATLKRTVFNKCGNG